MAVVLGTGLGALADEVENALEIDTAQIPGYPASSVEGHHGKLVEGELSGVKTLVFRGRVHYYEGYSPAQVCAPVYLSKALGINSILFTNAAGAVNPDFNPGDFMLVVDFLNFMFMNPLRGMVNPAARGGAVNVHSALNRQYIDEIRKAALTEKIILKEGVLGAMTGPSYETPSEVRMLQRAGVDAVSMSTVPELIICASLGMKAAAISCISNMATGVSPRLLTHEEVQKVSADSSSTFIRLLKAAAERIGKIV